MFGPIVILDGPGAMHRKAVADAERIAAHRIGAEERIAKAQTKRDRKAAKRLHDAERSTVGGLASTERLRGAVHTSVFFGEARELPDR